MGSRLRLTVEPSPDRELVLCIPGTLCAPAIFPPDPPGGDLQLVPVSWMESPGPWDLPTLGARLVALVDELGRGPLRVAGHSTGGAIALAAATADPQAVRGLLVSNTGANMHGHGDAAAILRAFTEEWGPDVRRRVLERCFHYRPDEALMAQLVAWAEDVPQEVGVAAVASQLQLDLQRALHRITAPTVVAHGRHDRARPVPHAELLAREIPHAELVLLDAGHTPMAEDPRGWSTALRRLQALTRGPGPGRHPSP